jgi:hypothetical protein
MENEIIQNKKEETKEINSKQEVINIGNFVRISNKQNRLVNYSK